MRVRQLCNNLANLIHIELPNRNLKELPKQQARLPDHLDFAKVSKHPPDRLKHLDLRTPRAGCWIYMQDVSQCLHYLLRRVNRIRQGSHRVHKPLWDATGHDGIFYG
jgi:hypothetical protein